MSSYTIELRRIVEEWTRPIVKTWFTDGWELSDYLIGDQYQTIVNSGIWDLDRLVNRIIDYYWLREIGFETIGEFKRQIKILMPEIMNAKAPLIYTLALEYDPLYNEDFTESIKRDVARDATSNSTIDSSGLGVNSDTPQGQINKAEILTGKYASATNANSNETSGMVKNNDTEAETIVRHSKGNRGITSTYQNLIKQYRDIIAPVENDVIMEVGKLFMGIY